MCDGKNRENHTSISAIVSSMITFCRTVLLDFLSDKCLNVEMTVFVRHRSLYIAELI